MSGEKSFLYKVAQLTKIRRVAFLPALYDNLTKSWYFGAINDYHQSINSIISKTEIFIPAFYDF